MPLVLMNLIFALTSEGTGTSVMSLDFTDMLTSSVNLITSDYAKYAVVAGTAGFAIWAAPKALILAKKFFNAVAR